MDLEPEACASVSRRRHPDPLVLPTSRLISSPAPAALVAATYLALSSALTRFANVFEFDADEGNNLIKALLVARGHRFFTEIWSDQPPLFAYLLRAGFEVFGWQVSVARYLVLVFSALLVFAVYDTVVLSRARSSERAWPSHVAAGLAALLVVGSWGFARLRVSAMIGMPSVTLATLAVWAALRAGGSAKRRAWIWASGALLGISISTKLFTAYLLPVVLLAVVLSLWGQLPRRAARTLAAHWCAAFFAALLVGLSPALLSGSPAELYLTHWGARAAAYRSRHSLLGFLDADAAMFALTAMGVTVAILQRERAALPWVLWLVLSAVALGTHDPLWAHHHQLLVPAAAALAGLGVSRLIELPRGKIARPLSSALALIAAAGTLWHVHDRLPDLRHPWRKNDAREWAAVDKLRTLARGYDGYIVSSRQVYAFYAGLPVPPELSVTSAKRFRAGGVDGTRIAELAEKHRVRFVILTRRWSGSIRGEIKRRIKGRYELVYSDPQNQQLEIYQRKASAP